MKIYYIHIFSERKHYSVKNPFYFFLISWIMVFSVEVDLFDGGFGVIDKVGYQYEKQETGNMIFGR